LPNSVTKVTKTFFEPALDYVVVKVPRWDLKKFRKVSRKIGTGMKSVGEVMAIGRKFEEALQKALRMLETGAQGLVANGNFIVDDLRKELQEPTEERIFAIVQAIKDGFSVDEISKLSHIDRWFLHKISHVVDLEKELRKYRNKRIPKELLRKAKQAGFSDNQISILTDKNQDKIREYRKKLNLSPVIKQIDTLGAEYPAQTNYLYITYNGESDDIQFNEDNSVIILGSGSYRIGSSVEFDWCAVNAGMTLRKLGYHTVMINYNPETVSTDYDEFDKLFFDEIRLETIIEIYEKLNATGVIISMGGQIPNNLALKLHSAGLKILGTSPDSIDNAENRMRFSNMLDQLGIDQPVWNQMSSLEEAKKFAKKTGYPVLIRPSYVLSGAAMAVASNDLELTNYLKQAVEISPEHPVVISKFLENAKEIEIDAVARHGKIIAHAISEHVENAGVHSGDATLVLPPQRTYLETIRQIRQYSKNIANALKIHGPFNIQFVAKQNEVKVIECNLRVSRSFPFVSKVLKQNFIDVATKVIMDQPVSGIESSIFEVNYVGVKAPQFSFTRLEGADPILGVEMASTGEVGCLGDDFEEAFLKALISVGYRWPLKSILLSTGTIESKAELLESSRILQQMGIKFYATSGTAKFMQNNNIPSSILHWPLEDKQPNTVNYIKEGKIDLVINIPKSYNREELTNGYIIRRTAVDHNVPLITNRQFAMRFVEAVSRKRIEDLLIRNWADYS
jgi:carbamoyl-phosphate synthase large subunit